MKNILLLTFLFIAATAMSQDSMMMAPRDAPMMAPLKITRDHYTVSGGILGGGNYSKFNVKSNTTFTANHWKFGYNGGIWLNFPVTNGFSFELQGLYSRVGGKYTEGSVDKDQELGYISVPLLMKFGLGKNFAIILGPEFDLLVHGREKNADIDNEASWKDNDVAAVGGFELFPHSPVSLYARYIYGINNISGLTNPNIKNQGVQAGVKIKFFGRHVPADSDGDGIVDSKDNCPKVPGLARYQGCPIPDTDGDGINDEVDKCPAVAGIAKYNGCPIPDADGDGINDEEDKCPTVAGLAKYQGCPIPDTDGDGINDEEDKCPTVAGAAKYQGCPVPDTDKDGVPDDEDKCPNEAGPASNSGCPVIDVVIVERVNKAAQNIFFSIGSSKLLAKSFKSLKDVVKIMNDNPSYKIDVDGHTSNTGGTELNQKLSDSRAKSVRQYLIDNGVDESRIVATGYGEDKPIADNKTATGRAKNRRVEMHLKNY